MTKEEGFWEQRETKTKIRVPAILLSFRGRVKVEKRNSIKTIFNKYQEQIDYSLTAPPSSSSMLPT